MPKLIILVRTMGLVALVAVPVWTYAATIYGVVRRDNQPLHNESVVLNCAGTEVTTNTDSNGSYRLTLPQTGRCTVRIRGAGAEVILYSNPTRYDFEVGGSDSQPRLLNR
ncbi:carboxypeptidase-like regulatory domain-containing protein [Paraburkholderia caribensis]|uniref:carboxypeptidase-like regulatory domain-containing protein n=1 Tax=Paraburkholderia caribensis TaxID=75105 RepID=UPI00338EE6F9